MQKISILVLSLCMALVTILHGQNTPNAFNYSAVARNNSGQAMANKTIALQISILKNSSTGEVVYTETHNVTTDAFGLFNLSIGTGTVQSGNLNINWGANTYYLKVSMDANGGNNYLTMGTTQLLSVPYALHAKTAESIVGGTGGGGSGNFTHYIGEEFGGGVIFHLWKDAQGVEHGLIVDKTDLSTSQVWSNVNQTAIGSSAQSSWDGLSNSNAIVAQAGHTNSAAALCLASTNGGQSDWYLPSIQELNMLWNNYFTVVKALSQISGATQMSSNYWSSTESNYLGDAWYFYFSGGSAYSHYKYRTYYVRAVRAF